MLPKPIFRLRWFPKQGFENLGSLESLLQHCPSLTFFKKLDEFSDQKKNKTGKERMKKKLKRKSEDKDNGMTNSENDTQIWEMNQHIMMSLTQTSGHPQEETPTRYLNPLIVKPHQICFSFAVFSFISEQFLGSKIFVLPQVSLK